MNKGHCLCGAVELETNQSVENINACHCKTCQQWGGGPFLSVDCKSDLHITGTDNV